MDMVLDLRGSNTATVKDIVDCRKVILIQVQDAIDHVCELIKSFHPIPDFPMCAESSQTFVDTPGLVYVKPAANTLTVDITKQRGDDNTFFPDGRDTGGV